MHILCFSFYGMESFINTFGNGVPKCPKNAANLFMNNLRKFRKFIISSISRFGNIKEV